MPRPAGADLRTILRKLEGSNASRPEMGKPKTPRWIETLRQAIKQQHGFGWSVRDVGGKVQLTRRYEDGSRSSVVLGLPWNAESTADVLGLLPLIRSRMEGHGLGLREAYDLLNSPEAPKPGQIDWKAAVERFRRHKVQELGDLKDSTFDAAYGPTMRQVLTLLASKPVPRDARALLGGLRDRHGGEPGSRGRKLRIQYTAQLLRFAVEGLGASQRWMPPSDLREYVGKAGPNVLREASTPLKDSQLVRLLEGIPDPRWRLAVGLLGCFGLRPVELRYCRANGDKLHVAYRKRNARGATKPGDVSGLDPEGLAGESIRLLRLLESGLIELPPMGSSDSVTAASIGQYLDRRAVWHSIKAEAAAAGERVTVYSLRHGFALRAHQHYDLSPRITASLMRHSLQTHQLHYGRWTDEETVDAALQRGRERAMLAASANTPLP